MSIILLFVDCKWIIREQFFDIVNVLHTKIKFLKMKYVRCLVNTNFYERIAYGWSYDGASNMCCACNGLQILFLQECPYVYYVHSFAHCLQIALVGAAEELQLCGDFFSVLINIVNFVGCSTKRITSLNELEKLKLKSNKDCLIHVDS